MAIVRYTTNSLVKLFEILANEYRLLILTETCLNHKTLVEIAKENNTSLAALQRHVNILRDSGLIKKGDKSYVITDTGEEIIRKLIILFGDIITGLNEKDEGKEWAETAFEKYLSHNERVFLEQLKKTKDIVENSYLKKRYDDYRKKESKKNANIQDKFDELLIASYI